MSFIPHLQLFLLLHLQFLFNIFGVYQLIGEKRGEHRSVVLHLGVAQAALGAFAAFAPEICGELLIAK